jgi:hypothetical protein
MKLDCRLYWRTLENARERLLDKAKLRDAREVASEFSCYTHVPLAAVVLYLLRDSVIGETPELRSQFENVVKFNGYEKVIPFD